MTDKETLPVIDEVALAAVPEVTPEVTPEPPVQLEDPEMLALMQAAGFTLNSRYRDPLTKYQVSGSGSLVCPDGTDVYLPGVVNGVAIDEMKMAFEYYLSYQTHTPQAAA